MAQAAAGTILGIVSPTAFEDGPAQAQTVTLLAKDFPYVRGRNGTRVKTWVDGSASTLCRVCCILQQI